MIGRREGQGNIINMAIDRIISIDYNQYDFDANKYYHNTYGVTVLDEKEYCERSHESKSITCSLYRD